MQNFTNIHLYSTHECYSVGNKSLLWAVLSDLLWFLSICLGIQSRKLVIVYRNRGVRTAEMVRFMFILLFSFLTQQNVISVSAAPVDDGKWHNIRFSDPLRLHMYCLFHDSNQENFLLTADLLHTTTIKFVTHYNNRIKLSFFNNVSQLQFSTKKQGKAKNFLFIKMLMTLE